MKNRSRKAGGADVNFTLPEFNLAELRKLINRVVFAVPKREGAHAPSILLLEADGQAVRAFGTDGHRLAVAEAPASTKGITERRCFVIPRDAVPLLKALPGSTVQAVAVSKTHYFFRAGNHNDRASATLLEVPKWEGKLRNYNKALALFPNEVTLALTVQARDLRACIEQSPASMSISSPSITFIYQGGEELIVGTDSIAAKKQGVNNGNEATFRINAQYLSQFLKRTSDDELVISYIARGKPVMFTNGSYRYVIAPIMPS